jgi:hypothetical protein
MVSNLDAGKSNDPLKLGNVKPAVPSRFKPPGGVSVKLCSQFPSGFEMV